MNYVVLAVPVFFLLIGLELFITRLQEKDYYTLSDSVTDLGCGLFQQFTEVALKTFLFAGYLFLYSHWRIFEIQSHSVAAWVGCLLGQDFLYYWFHRKSHEVNAFWAAHVVHHSSEEYNLSVALRQGAFQPVFSWIFYLPLAVIGFPPLMFLTVSSIDTLYQFWIHTRAIGKLGPLEGILNTPSNHRVHHGRNPKYIDRNHAGMFVIWDRMFGTYVAEQEEPVYGITTPLRSWNPVWANLHYWVDLSEKARRAARPLDKLRLFLARPRREVRHARPAGAEGLRLRAVRDHAGRGQPLHVPAGGVAAGDALDDGRLHRGQLRRRGRALRAPPLGRAARGGAPRGRGASRARRGHPARVLDAGRGHGRRGRGGRGLALARRAGRRRDQRATGVSTR